jgi:hypothetical protein
MAATTLPVATQGRHFWHNGVFCAGCSMPRRLAIIIALSCATLMSGKAFAYLDPGTGSMILQGVIAGVALAWFTIKVYWYKITSLFGKKPPESLLDDDVNHDGEL